MYIDINGTEINQYPSSFKVKVMDLDSADGSFRTADGGMNRERIAVKRQITIGFPAMKWETMGELLKMMDDEFFEVNYPDPLEVKQLTKTFYVGDREAAIAIIKDGEHWWEGLNITLTER